MLIWAAQLIKKSPEGVAPFLLLKVCYDENIISDELEYLTKYHYTQFQIMLFQHYKIFNKVFLNLVHITDISIVKLATWSQMVRSGWSLGTDGLLAHNMQSQVFLVDARSRHVCVGVP